MLKLIIMLLLSINISCNDDQDRFERIDRLRVLGMKKNPSIASLNDTSVTLKWIIATPNKTAPITAVSATDENSPFSLPLELTNITTTKTSYATIDIHEVTSNINFPAVYLLPLGQSDEEKYRVSLNITQDGESIQAIGDVIRFPTTESVLDLVNNEPTAEIIDPINTETYSISDELKLKCNPPNETEENFKISWYSTAGKIDNFRACETTMEVKYAKKDETHTFIQCIRGLKTRSVQCDMVDIEFK